MDTIRNLQRMLSVRVPGAKPLVDWFVEELTATFDLHQVKPTPCLLMLAEDVVTHGLLVRLANKALKDAMKVVEPATEDAKKPRTKYKLTKEAAGLLDDIFKYREKYRKSMSDFTQACAAAGTPIPTGLSELFANVDAKLDGVMAAAVDFQKRKPPANRLPVPGAPLDTLRPDVQAIAPDANEAVLVEASAE